MWKAQALTAVNPKGTDMTTASDTTAVGNPDRSPAYALHLGTRDAEALLEVVPANLIVYRDGDSWEEWGDGHPGDPNPFDPHGQSEAEHIVLCGDNPDAMLADVAYFVAEGPNLARMSRPGQAGIFAVITSADDWSESLCTLRDDMHERAAATTDYLQVYERDRRRALRAARTGRGA
ncbi:MAG: hypothetical protein CMH36_08945 [Microbacterium sp.]|uniref:Uncharacterized protein n=2 Tax=Microbacterium TaxID=33882 RepID=A0A3C1KHH1_9MICO|nr:hypothetical protein [Microbacterium sp.]HAN26051.1 hypothetical protein [Microbacterium ginsengisoli]